jgi:glycosyltransferase involved in cell wall biosynthesis
MRVLVLTNIYPPHHYGGYELACRDVVARWRAAGHEVEVVTGDHRVPGVDEPDEPGVTRGLRFYWADHEILHPPPWTRLAWERENRERLNGILDRFHPDVVSVWNHGAMSYALLAEVLERDLPLVLVVADNWLCWGPAYDLWTRQFDDRGALRAGVGRFVKALTRVPTRYPDLGHRSRALFASRWLLDNVRRDSRFTFDRAEVVPWGIDTARFPVRPARPWSGRLVFVGRVDERKGVLTAVRALEGRPDLSLDVVGPATPEQRARLLEVAEAVGAADRVAQREVGAAEVAAAYGGGDVALFPSEWGEPFGLVGLEAMACGVPLVATGTGGSGEYLRDEENCLLVPPADPAAMRAAVDRIASDPELRARLIAGGRAAAAAHTVDTMARGLLAAHEAEVASGSAG